MTLAELKDKLNAQHFVEPGMIEAALGFWFSDNYHIRSPFPSYIREPLRTESITRFIGWAEKVPAKSKKELNDEILAEKFEEILFECALGMVLTEDERLTIRYPFMVRIGDRIEAENKSGHKTISLVTDRSFIKRGDEAFMKVKLRNTETGEIEEKEFELPE